MNKISMGMTVLVCAWLVCAAGTATAAYFTGTGTLRILNGPHPDGTLMLVR